jgi:putative ABC transport system permease protein
VWLLAVRDLQLRRRRFLVGAAAASVVLAVALLLAGISASFDNEVDRTLDGAGADTWLVRAGASGPFTGPSSLPADLADRVRAADGVRAAEPVAVLRALTTTPRARMVNVLGVVPGGVGSPAGQAGALRGEGAVADASLGLEVGDVLRLNGAALPVRGVVEGQTYFAGTPTVFVALTWVQRFAYDGRPVATAVLARGRPAQPIPGLQALRPAAVADDLARPVEQAKGTISLIRLLLWVVAVGIIGSVLYVAALERVADFAVLKAIGVPDRTLAGGLALQAVLVALVASLAAMLLARLIEPASPMSVEVPLTSYVTLPLLGVAAALMASLAALRRAIGVDPARAFAG